LLRFFAGGNIHYRRAILKAIEELHDFQSRSNIDLIRRRTYDLLMEDNHAWNDALFMKTLKTIVRDGDIQQNANIFAELSPEYKKKRANSLVRHIDEHINSAPKIPEHTEAEHVHSEVPKEAPKRKPEHEKWKILPKKIYDKST